MQYNTELYSIQFNTLFQTQLRSIVVVVAVVVVVIVFYFNSTTSITQYSNKYIQYKHNGKLNTKI